MPDHLALLRPDDSSFGEYTPGREHPPYDFGDRCLSRAGIAEEHHIQPWHRCRKAHLHPSPGQPDGIEEVLDPCLDFFESYEAVKFGDGRLSHVCADRRNVFRHNCLQHRCVLFWNVPKPPVHCRHNLLVKHLFHKTDVSCAGFLVDVPV